MRNTDIAIVGGGLAGSLAGAMLARAGYDALVIDPHDVYPPDFRVEKLDDVQIATLEKTGLADVVRNVATPYHQLWIAKFGRVYEKRPSEQLGVYYDTLVNTLRAEVAGQSLIRAKVTAISTSADRQTVTLSNGDEVSARLVVLANGLNVGLRHKLGINREIISAAHSISIGFDVKPVDRPAFEFPSLTYYSERPAERMAYITLFPIGATMRANLFGHRDMDDPWLRQLRAAPQETLYALMPGLRNFLGDFAVTDFIKIRPIDLYVTDGYRQPGIVMVGDAFATSCPSAGTGARKAIMDVERLCNGHIPGWLATPGMDVDKITTFYDDPAKRACDAYSLAKAYSLRSLCIDTSPRWRLERWARFATYRGRSGLRAARRWFAAPPTTRPEEPAADGARRARSSTA